MPIPDVVAIVNTSPDTVEMLRVMFQLAGFSVISGYVHDIRDGRLDFEGFMRQHDPAAIVWDIAPPYEQQWKFFQHIRSRPTLAERQFVLTTTNVQQLRKVAGDVQPLYEIIGKPYDLEEVVKAVKVAVGLD